jgi:hypothetical protein
MDPLAKKSIFYSKSFSRYRKYFTADLSRVTAWLNLTKDEYYYIEARQDN